MQIITKSQSQTELFGKNLAAKLKGGDILLLSGELGAGKTSLVKGIAAGLGIKNEITSPTFTLMNVYPVKSGKAGPPSAVFNRVNTLVHIDTYRLKDEKELSEIGVEDYLGQANTICIIEWPEKIADLLKKYDTTSITIEHGEKPEERKIITS
ncbi:MAG TPA: tRNA (adenosine(37)-N6)-threonylcarbamoyltransferase complex ATPase subunit type 1 TsaE [Candidatus Udaeobacter sp.]|nr:tRNA (adenosine(37)-N6)-threonylcarbamoyltransferase complex ATPase subunit type 1 TsaE [Candidatus Udaeobacter sp.]